MLLKGAGKDDFFTFTLKDLQDYLAATYKARRKPHNVKSLHCAIWPNALEEFHNRWDFVDRALGENLFSPAESGGSTLGDGKKSTFVDRLIYDVGDLELIKP